MRTLLKILFAVVVVVLLVAVGVYAWASVVTSRSRSRTIETHQVEFPVPFPLGADDAAGSGLDAAARQDLERTRAVERGKHLVEARYVCTECHGQNFGGGVMIDAFPIGRILGPNLTPGRGGRTANYRPADWDRIVRHGVLPDGRPAMMPSEDFQRMSDQELSDIVSYVRTFPPVDNEVPAPTLGPLGRFLTATGRLHLSADMIAAHQAAHPVQPPETEVSPDFGQHLAAVCTGCHQPDFSGGPIPGGDPSWVPARNLTSHAEALGPWTYEQFTRALREGVRPDGTPIRPPMTLLLPYAQRMTDVEVQALWAYLRSIPPVAPAATAR